MTTKTKPAAPAMPDPGVPPPKSPMFAVDYRKWVANWTSDPGKHALNNTDVCKALGVTAIQFYDWAGPNAERNADTLVRAYIAERNKPPTPKVEFVEHDEPESDPAEVARIQRDTEEKRQRYLQAVADDKAEKEKRMAEQKAIADAAFPPNVSQAKHDADLIRGKRQEDVDEDDLEFAGAAWRSMIHTSIAKANDTSEPINEYEDAVGEPPPTPVDVAPANETLETLQTFGAAIMDAAYRRVGPNIQREKALLKAACTSDVIEVLYDKDGRSSFWIAKIEAFKFAQEPIKDQQESTVTEQDEQPKPISPAPLANLPEAPFSATFRLWHKTYNLEIQFTIRSDRVKDGVERVELSLDRLLGEDGDYMPHPKLATIPTAHIENTLSAPPAKPIGASVPPPPVGQAAPSSIGVASTNGDIRRDVITGIMKETHNGKTTYKLYKDANSDKAFITIRPAPMIKQLAALANIYAMEPGAKYAVNWTLTWQNGAPIEQAPGQFYRDMVSIAAN